MRTLPLILSLTASVAIPIVAVELDCLRYRHGIGRRWFRPQDMFVAALFYIALMLCFAWLAWRIEWTGGYGVLTLVMSGIVFHFYHERRTLKR